MLAAPTATLNEIPSELEISTFFTTKHISSGEGGVICTNSEDDTNHPNIEKPRSSQWSNKQVMILMRSHLTTGQMKFAFETYSHY